MCVLRMAIWFSPTPEVLVLKMPSAKSYRTTKSAPSSTQGLKSQQHAYFLSGDLVLPLSRPTKIRMETCYPRRNPSVHKNIVNPLHFAFAEIFGLLGKTAALAPTAIPLSSLRRRSGKLTRFSCRISSPVLLYRVNEVALAFARIVENDKRRKTRAASGINRRNKSLNSMSA